MRAKFEAAWGVELDPNPGLTVVEIAHGAETGDIKGMYIMGENPFMSDPNVARAREAFLGLDFLVVQDIFLTETAEAADVILPATSYFEKTGTYTNTDRRVQLGHKTLDAPGEARLDWEILADVMTRMGYPTHYDDVEEIWNEHLAVNASYKGLTYEHLAGPGKLWPCDDPETSGGEVVLFGDGYPTPTGRGKFSPAETIPPAELPSEEYPLVLNTGRTLQHWHTGSMTRRAKALDAIHPEARCEIHPDDLAALGIEDGSFVKLTTRRNSIRVKALASKRTSKGSVFIPFSYREAAANLLTTDELDPFGKIPVVQVRRGPRRAGLARAIQTKRGRPPARPATGFVASEALLRALAAGVAVVGAAAAAGDEATSDGDHGDERDGAKLGHVSLPRERQGPRRTRQRFQP